MRQPLLLSRPLLPNPPQVLRFGHHPPNSPKVVFLCSQYVSSFCAVQDGLLHVILTRVCLPAPVGFHSAKPPRLMALSPGVGRCLPTLGFKSDKEDILAGRSLSKYSHACNLGKSAIPAVFKSGLAPSWQGHFVYFFPSSFLY